MNTSDLFIIITHAVFNAYVIMVQIYTSVVDISLERQTQKVTSVLSPQFLEDSPDPFNGN